MMVFPVSSKGCGWFGGFASKKSLAPRDNQASPGLESQRFVAPKATVPYISERLGPPSLIPARLGRARSTSLREGSLAATGLVPTPRATVMLYVIHV
jgi:hypothetical protein